MIHIMIKMCKVPSLASIEQGILILHAVCVGHRAYFELSIVLP